MPFKQLSNSFKWLLNMNYEDYRLKYHPENSPKNVHATNSNHQQKTPEASPEKTEIVYKPSRGKLSGYLAKHCIAL